MRERAPQKHKYFHVSKYICIPFFIQSMQFPSSILMVWCYKRQWQNTNIENELRTFLHFHSHSKTAISFNILLVLQILCLRNIYIFRSQITSAYIYNQFSSLSQIMVWRYIYNLYATIYQQNTNIEKILCEQPQKCSHFHILRLQFLSIFCWYFGYFVGIYTNDMLVGLHVPINFQKKLRKSIIGGQFSPPPP